jgi:protein gp37
MAENSKIEWTDNTFNPWVGCFKVSPGCKNCYAEELMTRKGRWANTWGPPETTERIRTSAANWAKPLQWDRQAQKDGKRVKVFCSSLADVFEDNVQVKSWRLDLFMLISDTPNLDWQILTKRPEFARVFFEQHTGFLLPNVWVGTSVENQEQADERIPELLRIPAAIRFLSVEPLLGPVSLKKYLNLGEVSMQGWNKVQEHLTWIPMQEPSIHWVIVGGESGQRARPFDLDWADLLVEQCKDADVSVFVKQLGSNPRMDNVGYFTIDKKGGDINEFPERLQVREFPNFSTVEKKSK